MRSSLGRALRLGAVAVVGGTLALSGCTSSDDAPRPPGEPQAPFDLPRAEAPVAAPGVDAEIRGDTATAAPIRTAERPNLLMITTDDAALKDMEFMPHLQRLVAREGVTLENGLAPTPICVPARASLLTGQYARNHGAVTIKGERGGYAAFDDAGTLPVWLQDAGYDTLFLGKYLNGYTAEAAAEHEPPGWTTWRPTLDFSTYNFANPKLLIDGTPVATHTYSTTVLSDQTQELLRDPARTKKPWYLWVNYVAPHHGGPRDDDDPVRESPDDPPPPKTTVPDARDRNTFSDLELPTGPEMFEEDASDKGIVGEAREPIPEARRLQLREVRQQRVEALQSVDRAVARTIRTLRRTNQLDNTYVVFTSDNGFAIGEHNLEGKLWYFRDQVGVPMYVRGPGLPKGITSRAPVTNADWAPTFAALAGATPTRDVDGANVMRWLASDATRRVVPIEAYRVADGSSALYTGVVVGPWTYVKGEGGREEMYYTDVDPGQLHNLRRDPRYTPKFRQLRRIAARFEDCSGRACPRAFYR